MIRLSIRSLMWPNVKSNVRKKTAPILFGKEKAALFESTDFDWWRNGTNYCDLLRERQNIRLQVVSEKRRAVWQMSDNASWFGLPGIAKWNRESDSAAEKQQTASTDEGRKTIESRIGRQAGQNWKCDSPTEDFPHLERTLPASPKTIRFEIQFDCRFA